MTPEQALQTIKDTLVLIEKTGGKNNWNYNDIEPALDKVIEAKNELEYYLHNY